MGSSFIRLIPKKTKRQSQINKINIRKIVKTPFFLMG
jgi:hypothetical protein